MLNQQQIKKVIFRLYRQFRHASYQKFENVLNDATINYTQTFQILAEISGTCTAQKMTFSIKDFFSKCDQIRNFLRIWSHLMVKSLMENFIFYAVLLDLQ